MKAVVAAFNQEKVLVGAFFVITNLRMDLSEALLHNSAWDEQKTRTYHPPFIEANGSEVNSLLCWLEAGAQDFLQLFIHEVLWPGLGKNIWSVSHNRSIIGWMLCKISSINILNFQYTLPAEPKDTSAHTSVTLNLTLMELTLEKHTYYLYIVLGYCDITIVFSYSLSCKGRNLYLN